MFVWHLIDIDPLCDAWDCFAPVIKLTLFPIEALSWSSRYTLNHPFSKIHQYVGHCELYLWLMLSLIAMMHRLIVFDKNACYVPIFLTNFDCLMKALKKRFRYTLTLLYDYDLNFFLFGMLVLIESQNHFSQPRYLQINRLIVTFPSIRPIETSLGLRGVLPPWGTFPISNLILVPRLGFFKNTFFHKYGVTSLRVSFLFYFSF